MESLTGFMSGINQQLIDYSKDADLRDQLNHERRLEYLVKNKDKILKNKKIAKIRLATIAERNITDLIHNKPINGTNIDRFISYITKYPEFNDLVAEYFDKVEHHTYNISKIVTKNRIIQLRKLRSLLPKNHPKYHEYVGPDSESRITRVIWRR